MDSAGIQIHDHGPQGGQLLSLLLEAPNQALALPQQDVGWLLALHGCNLWPRLEASALPN